jgi:hypothetical protein
MHCHQNRTNTIYFNIRSHAQLKPSVNQFEAIAVFTQPHTHIPRERQVVPSLLTHWAIHNRKLSMVWYTTGTDIRMRTCPIMHLPDYHMSYMRLVQNHKMRTMTVLPHNVLFRPQLQEYTMLIQHLFGNKY